MVRGEIRTMNNKIKYTMGERIFQAANTVFMLLILLITLYPFYYAVIASISDGSELVRGNVLFLPVKPTLEAYTLIPGIKNFFSLTATPSSTRSRVPSSAWW